jgi:hypothetical protein
MRSAAPYRHSLFPFLSRSPPTPSPWRSATFSGRSYCPALSSSSLRARGARGPRRVRRTQPIADRPPPVVLPRRIARGRSCNQGSSLASVSPSVWLAARRSRPDAHVGAAPTGQIAERARSLLPPRFGVGGRGSAHSQAINDPLLLQRLQACKSLLLAPTHAVAGCSPVLPLRRLSAADASPLRQGHARPWRHGHGLGPLASLSLSRPHRRPLPAFNA